MLDKTKLNKDEERIIRELTDKLIKAGSKNKTSRDELFRRLSTLVEGVKLGLINNQPAHETT